nr:ATP-binding protein [uncultured Methanolobus sp.]
MFSEKRFASAFILFVTVTLFSFSRILTVSALASSSPEGSISFFDQYRTELYIIIIALIIQFILISLLLVNRRILKNTQADLIAAKEKAEDADLLKSQFLSNMSHELRTPLNGILGFSQLIVVSSPDEKCSHYASLIKKSGERLLLIIDDILDTSKIEADQLVIHKERFSINAMLDEIYSLFKIQFESKEPPVDLILVKNIDDESSMLYCDEHRLRQIFNNLLGNAMKFTEKGKVEFGYDIKDGFMMFYVSDTGIGIQEDHYECVFGRFRQAHDASTRKYKGTGLGMSISKSLTELLGGSMTFESEVGVGTTFYFSIPYVQDAE